MPHSAQVRANGLGGVQVSAKPSVVDELVRDVDATRYSAPLRKLLWRLLQPDPAQRPRYRPTRHVGQSNAYRASQPVWRGQAATSYGLGMICLGTLATVEAAACLHDPMRHRLDMACGSIDELLKKKNLQPKKSANKKHDHERPRRESAGESVSPTLKLTRRERRRSNTTNSTDSRSTDRDSACAE